MLDGFVTDITDRKRALEEIRDSYDIQNVTNSILHLSLEDISLDEILKRSLDLLLSVKKFIFESKGEIFLVEEDNNTFVLKVHQGFTK